MNKPIVSFSRDFFFFPRSSEIMFSHTFSVLTPDKSGNHFLVIWKTASILLKDEGYAGTRLSYRLMEYDSELSLAGVLKRGSIKLVSLRKQAGCSVPMSSILHTLSELNH